MNDKLIRKQLFKRLYQETKNTDDTHIVNEFNVCNGLARIDIVVMNGNLHGFEIKSDFDTLYRLPNQIYFYNKSLDRITLTTTHKHLEEARKLIPKWWGIMLARYEDNTFTLKEIRKPKENPEKELNAFLELLCKEELIQIIVNNSLKYSKNANRDKLCNVILNNLKSESIYSDVRYILKSRKNWRI